MTERLQDTSACALVDISSDPATITIDGQEYTLRRMQLGDYAAAQAYIRRRRMEAGLEVTKGMSEDIRARLLGEVLCRPMSLLDIWSEFEGECIMLHRGVLKDGKQIPLEHVLTKMPPIERRFLVKVLLWVCGLPPVEEADDSPFGQKSTSIPSDPKSGTRNSLDLPGSSNSVPTNSSV